MRFKRCMPVGSFIAQGVLQSCVRWAIEQLMSALVDI